eukprot:CCRYP_006055-RB/>CCRYP_006055-RB protein AED:0.02 eAED:0.02 QI:235/1/1/1/1/1/2/1889/849
MTDSPSHTSPSHPLDVTMEMMSQTTTSLLSHMAMDVSLHAASTAAASAAAGCGSTTTCRLPSNDVTTNHTTRRTPLHPINNATIINHDHTSNALRKMGNKESLYKQNYDGFVCQLLRSYSTRSNKFVVSTRKFAEMNANERNEAMSHVDRLLQRWNDKGVKRDSINSHSRGDVFNSLQRKASRRGHDKAAIAHPLSTMRHGPNASKESSTTTLEEELHNPSHDPSITTMLDDPSLSLLGEESSMVLLSDEDDESVGQHDARTAEDESRFSEQDTNRAECSSSSSAVVSSIERTRHSQHSHAARIDDHDDYDEEEEEGILSSPKVVSHSHTSKRCASHSGKRGLKSRYRASSSWGEDVESALVRHWNRTLDDGVDRLDCGHDDDDATFSCGSPIERRFSEDFSEEEVRDTVAELVERKDGGYGGGDGGDEAHSEEGSRFSFQQGAIDFHKEYDGGYDDSQPHAALSRTFHQQSQWSTFQNADLKHMLTHDEEDDSPVRRRMIRFDGCSQPMVGPSYRGRNGSSVPDNSDETSMHSDQHFSLQEKMADMAVNEEAGKHPDNDKEADGDDPIQTVRNLSRRAKALESQGVDSSLLDEVAPTDIRLRDGAHFRMDPLRCRQMNDKSESQQHQHQQQRHSKSAKKQQQQQQSKSVMKSKYKGNSAKVATAAGHYSSDSENSLSDPEPSFIDPISRFPTRVAARLNVAFEFLMEKERGAHHHENTKQVHVQSSNIDHNESCGVLLSMPIQQIVSVTSKLLLQTIKSARSHQRSMNSLSTKTKRFTPLYNLTQEKEVLGGGTLIVLRGKEDIAQWEVALREYTSLSVMNHAELQSNLRKLANTAAKCAGFDVVLST